MVTKQKPLGGIGVVYRRSERERDQYIAAVVTNWEKELRHERPTEGQMPFITISRQYGCLAVEFGMRLANRMNEKSPSGLLWTVYDREIVQKIADDLHIGQRLIELLTEHSRARVTEYLDTHFQKRPTKDDVIRKMVQAVRGLCEKGHSIVIGRGGSIVAAGSPAGFHIRIVGPMEWRIKQIAAIHQISLDEAEKRVRVIDKERQSFTFGIFGKDVADPDLYDMIINQSRFSMDEGVELVIHAMRLKGLHRVAER